MNQNLLNKVEMRIEDKIIKAQSVSGGCISNAQIIYTESGKKYFLKTNSSQPADMFIKESNGLIELSKANVIRIPNVISTNSNYIVLECIENRTKIKNFYEDFGRKFAQLHECKADRFGFYEDNYIGSNPQINIPEKTEGTHWTEFYFNKRILYQYRLAKKNGYDDRKLTGLIKKLENKIADILNGSQEQPSLLHGDLWSGNYIADNYGEACLIDPAVYYGHREADLAMTKLFGGFASEFYDSYNEYYPLSAGYEYRENIYKLYHVMNHLNLFGSGYYTQTISLISYYL